MKNRNRYREDPEYRERQIQRAKLRYLYASEEEKERRRQAQRRHRELNRYTEAELTLQLDEMKAAAARLLADVAAARVLLAEQVRIAEAADALSPVAAQRFRDIDHQLVTLVGKGDAWLK